jgi:hypothetical protein
MAAISAKPAAAAVAYLVTIDTSGVSGTSGYLDLQFNPGAPSSQAATAQVVAYSMVGGALGAALPNIGDVTGALPGTVTFVNDTALNDYTNAVTFGTTIVFTVILSGPAVDAPNGNPFGTSFFVSLYNSAFVPILTTNPSGAAGEIDINTFNGTVTTQRFPNSTPPPAFVVTFTPVPVPVNDFIQLSYAANLNLADAFINVTNAGTKGGYDVGDIFGRPEGGICVNAYFFDPNEELLSCCSCYVSPNGLHSFSLQKDFLANLLTPGAESAGTVVLAASTDNGTGKCTNSAATWTVPEHGMRAWMTRAHNNTTVGPTSFQITENHFTFVTVDASEQAKLLQLCGTIVTNGSTHGVCSSCTSSGLSSSKQ